MPSHAASTFDLQALARKWHLNKGQPTFWRDHSTSLRLSLAILRRQEQANTVTQMQQGPGSKAPAGRLSGVSAASRSYEDDLTAAARDGSPDHDVSIDASNAADGGSKKLATSVRRLGERRSSVWERMNDANAAAASAAADAPDREVGSGKAGNPNNTTSRSRSTLRHTASQAGSKASFASGANCNVVNTSGSARMRPRAGSLPGPGSIAGSISACQLQPGQLVHAPGTSRSTVNFAGRRNSTGSARGSTSEVNPHAAAASAAAVRLPAYRGDIFATHGSYDDSVLYLSRQAAGSSRRASLPGVTSALRASASRNGNAGNLPPSSDNGLLTPSYTATVGRFGDGSQQRQKHGFGGAGSPGRPAAPGGRHPGFIGPSQPDGSQQQQQMQASVYSVRPRGGVGFAGDASDGAGSHAGSCCAGTARNHKPGSSGVSVTFSETGPDNASRRSSATATAAQRKSAIMASIQDQGGSTESRTAAGDGDDDDGNGDRKRSPSLLDGDAIVTALSRGGHASTDFTLRLLESAAATVGDGTGTTPKSVRDTDDVDDEDGRRGPQQVKLTLRQQSALALREMSRAAGARRAIVEQGGFAALLQVLVESEAGAQNEAHIVEALAAAAAASSATGPGSQPRSRGMAPAAASSVAGSSVEGDHDHDEAASRPRTGGSISSVATSSNAAVAARLANVRSSSTSMGARTKSDPTLSATPHTETLMNCLVAIANLSATQPEDERSVFDQPTPIAAGTSAPATPVDISGNGSDASQRQQSAPKQLVLPSGLITALAGLAPSARGKTRCLLTTTLHNLSAQRQYRDRLLTEDAAEAIAEMMVPDVFHAKGTGAIGLSQLNKDGTVANGMGSHGDPATGVSQSPAFWKDVEALMASTGANGLLGEAAPTAASVMQQSGTLDPPIAGSGLGDGQDLSAILEMLMASHTPSNPAGAMYRKSALALIDRLVAASSETEAATSYDDQGGHHQQLCTAASLLEDAFCLDAGIRTLCNLAGCAVGASEILDAGVLGTISAIFTWLDLPRQAMITSHLLYNLSRTRLHAKAASEAGGVLMLNSTIGNIIALAGSAGAIPPSLDFALRRSLLALCRMTLNPHAAEHVLWSRGAATIADAVLAAGNMPVTRDSGESTPSLGVTASTVASDAAETDIADRVGLLPDAEVVSDDADDEDYCDDAEDGNSTMSATTRYSTALLHRKAAAALCRLAFGEPAPTGMQQMPANMRNGENNADGDTGVDGEPSDGDAVPGIGTQAGGWDRPSGLYGSADKSGNGAPSSPSGAERVGFSASNCGGSVAGAGVAGPATSIPAFNPANEVDRDKERCLRITAFVSQPSVCAALCRLMFSSDACTRKIAATAVSSIARVPAACEIFLRTGGAGALLLSAHAPIPLVQALSSAVFNASCRRHTRVLLLSTAAASDTDSGTDVAPTSSSSDVAIAAMDGLLRATRQAASDNSAEAEAASQPVLELLRKAEEEVKHNQKGLGRLMPRPSHAGATRTPHAVNHDAPGRSRLPVIASLLIIARKAMDIIARTHVDAALSAITGGTFNQVRALLSPKAGVSDTMKASSATPVTDAGAGLNLADRKAKALGTVGKAFFADETAADDGDEAATAAGSKTMREQKCSTVVAAATAEYVDACATLSYAIAAIRNLTAEKTAPITTIVTGPGGTRAPCTTEVPVATRVLASGVLPILMALLTPLAAPASSAGQFWTPYPLTAVADALHVAAHLAADGVCRQALLHSGLLPALLPICFDAAGSVLMSAAAASAVHIRMDYVRRVLLDVARGHDVKKTVDLAAAVNAHSAGTTTDDAMPLAALETAAADAIGGFAPSSSQGTGPLISLPPSIGGGILPTPSPTSPVSDAGNVDGGLKSPGTGTSTGAGPAAANRQRRSSLTDRRLSLNAAGGNAGAAGSGGRADDLRVALLEEADSDIFVSSRVSALMAAAAEARKQCGSAVAAIAMGCSTKHAGRLLDLGVLDALVALANLSREGEPIRERSVAAIQRLAVDDALARDFVRAGAVEALVALCPSMSERVRRSCVGGLLSFSRVVGCEQALVDANAVPALLAVALLRTSEAAVQTRCVQAVHNLLGAPECRMKVLSQGAIWALQKLALSRDVSTQRAVAVCMYRLACDPECQSALVSQGGLRSLIAILKKAYGLKQSFDDDDAADADDNDDNLPESLKPAPVAGDGAAAGGDLIMAAIRSIASADADAKVGLPVPDLLSPTSAIRKDSTGGTGPETGAGCDAVVAAYFAGVLAAVSRVPGMGDSLVAQGAVDAMVCLCDAAEGPRASKAPTGQSVSTMAASAVGPLSPSSTPPPEAADLARLRPSCALGLYNMSCTSDVRMRAKVISGGAPAIFARLAGLEKEQMVTRHLCVLGLCNLMWGPAPSPSIPAPAASHPLSQANRHARGAEDSGGVPTAADIPPFAFTDTGPAPYSYATPGNAGTASSRIGRRSSAAIEVPGTRLLVAQAGGVSAFIALAQSTASTHRDRYASLLALHHLSCHFDVHDVMLREGVVPELVQLLSKASSNAQVTVAATRPRPQSPPAVAPVSPTDNDEGSATGGQAASATAEAADDEQPTTRRSPSTAASAALSVELDCAMLAAAALANLCQHPDTGPKAMFMMGFSEEPPIQSDNGSASASTLPISPSGVAANGRMVSSIVDSGSILLSMLRPASHCNTSTSNEDDHVPAFDAVHAERASMAIESIVAVIGTLLDATNVHVKPPAVSTKNHPDTAGSDLGVAPALQKSKFAGKPPAGAAGKRRSSLASKAKAHVTIPFPYVNACVNGGVIELLHAVIAVRMDATGATGGSSATVLLPRTIAAVATQLGTLSVFQVARERLMAATGDTSSELFMRRVVQLARSAMEPTSDPAQPSAADAAMDADAKDAEFEESEESFGGEEPLQGFAALARRWGMRPESFLQPSDCDGHRSMSGHPTSRSSRPSSATRASASVSAPSRGNDALRQLEAPAITDETDVTAMPMMAVPPPSRPAAGGSTTCVQANATVGSARAQSSLTQQRRNDAADAASRGIFEEAALDVQDEIIESFDSALSKETREACARILCSMANDSDTVGLLLPSGAPSALIRLSRHPECSPQLQRACLRAICMMALAEDEGGSGAKAPIAGSGTSASAAKVGATVSTTSKRKGQKPASAGSRPSSNLTAVIESGAVEALIAVMQTEDPSDADAQRAAAAAKARSKAQESISESLRNSANDAATGLPRDYISEYLSCPADERHGWWSTVSPSDLVLHPHAHLLWPLLPLSQLRASSPTAPRVRAAGTGPAFAGTSSTSAAANAGAATISISHPTTIDLNGVLLAQRDAAERARILQLRDALSTDKGSGGKGNTSGFKVPGCEVEMLPEAGQPILYTASSHPAGRITMLPLPCFMSSTLHSLRALATGNADGAEASSREQQLVGHATFIGYDSASSLRNRVMEAARSMHESEVGTSRRDAGSDPAAQHRAMFLDASKAFDSTLSPLAPAAFVPVFRGDQFTAGSSQPGSASEAPIFGLAATPTSVSTATTAHDPSRNGTKEHLDAALALCSAVPLATSMPLLLQLLLVPAIASSATLKAGYGQSCLPAPESASADALAEILNSGGEAGAPGGSNGAPPAAEPGVAALGTGATQASTKKSMGATHLAGSSESDDGQQQAVERLTRGVTNLCGWVKLGRQTAKISDVTRLMSERDPTLDPTTHDIPVIPSRGRSRQGVVYMTCASAGALLECDPTGLSIADVAATRAIKRIWGIAAGTGAAGSGVSAGLVLNRSAAIEPANTAAVSALVDILACPDAMHDGVGLDTGEDGCLAGVLPAALMPVPSIIGRASEEGAFIDAGAPKLLVYGLHNNNQQVLLVDDEDNAVVDGWGRRYAAYASGSLAAPLAGRGHSPNKQHVRQASVAGASSSSRRAAGTATEAASLAVPSPGRRQRSGSTAMTMTSPGTGGRSRRGPTRGARLSMSDVSALLPQLEAMQLESNNSNAVSSTTVPFVVTPGLLASPSTSPLYGIRASPASSSAPSTLAIAAIDRAMTTASRPRWEVPFPHVHQPSAWAPFTRDADGPHGAERALSAEAKVALGIRAKLACARIELLAPSRVHPDGHTGHASAGYDDSTEYDGLQGAGRLDRDTHGALTAFIPLAASLLGACTAHVSTHGLTHDVATARLRVISPELAKPTDFYDDAEASHKAAIAKEQSAAAVRARSAPKVASASTTQLAFLLNPAKDPLAGEDANGQDDFSNGYGSGAGGGATGRSTARKGSAGSRTSTGAGGGTGGKRSGSRSSNNAASSTPYEGGTATTSTTTTTTSKSANGALHAPMNAGELYLTPHRPAAGSGYGQSSASGTTTSRVSSTEAGSSGINKQLQQLASSPSKAAWRPSGDLPSTRGPGRKPQLDLSSGKPHHDRAPSSFVAASSAPNRQLSSTGPASLTSPLSPLLRARHFKSKDLASGSRSAPSSPASRAPSAAISKSARGPDFDRLASTTTSTAASARRDAAASAGGGSLTTRGRISSTTAFMGRHTDFSTVHSIKGALLSPVLEEGGRGVQHSNSPSPSPGRWTNVTRTTTTGPGAGNGSSTGIRRRSLDDGGALHPKFVSMAASYLSPAPGSKSSRALLTTLSNDPQVTALALMTTPSLAALGRR